MLTNAIKPTRKGITRLPKAIFLFICVNLSCYSTSTVALFAFARGLYFNSSLINGFKPLVNCYNRSEICFINHRKIDILLYKTLQITMSHFNKFVHVNVNYIVFKGDIFKLLISI